MSNPSIRAFENLFADFNGFTSLLDPNTKKLAKKQSVELRSLILDKLLWKLELEIDLRVNSKDSSVYTGTAGLALMYIHLFSIFDRKEYLSKALAFLASFKADSKNRKVSFLCGDAGPLAVSIVLYNEMDKKDEVAELIEQLQEIAPKVISLESEVPEELLTGKAGYLFALLYVCKNVKNSVSELLIRNVVKTILKSGQSLARKEWAPSPLVFKLHGSHFLGIAHGVAGILYTLLLAREFMSIDDLNHLIKPSIDCILSLKLPSGNFPAYVGNDIDRLIHWCHGATGILYLLALAYDVFGETRYLESAIDCGEAIWERGLLKKGYGLCHGVSGNGFAFLRLFQITGDEKYIYRATKFGEWCNSYGKHGCRTADNPLSLYEGLAGTVYFLASLLDPHKAVFPAFQLD